MSIPQLQIILISSFIFISLKSTSQCIADAGNDTVLCLSFDSYTPMQIGGTPTASGGSGDYNYTWVTFYQDILGTHSASDFLDDSTASNPLLENTTSDSLIFHLMVTDDSGNICYDTVKFFFDEWACALGACYFVINEGDTVTLWPTCASNFPPYDFQWNPDYHISDASAANPLAWPDTTTDYHLTMIDSRGCYAPYGQHCTVNVNPSSVFPINKNKGFSEVFPDPINENSCIRFENSCSKRVSLEIFNLVGKKIFQTTSSGNTVQIGNAIQTSGEYFYRISIDGKTISIGRFTSPDNN